MTGWSAVLPAWAAVLLVAGAAKLRRPDETALALRAVLGGSGDGWRLAVRVGAATEAVLGATSLLLGGRLAAMAMAAGYAGFAAYVAWARAGRRPLATCGCLGEPDTPPTWTHSLLCLVAAASAAMAAAGTSAPPSVGSMLISLGHWSPAYVAAVAAGAYATVLLLGAGPRLAELRRSFR